MIKKEIILVIASFLIVICSFSAISASDEITTIQEANALNVSSYATNFTDLQSSIDSYDSIELEFNVTKTNDEKDEFNNGIIINKTVTIDGNGHIIDANNYGRIFSITNSGSLTLKNIIISNGNASSASNYNHGGAIFNDGNLSIFNSNFTNNYGQFGGAIYIQNSSETIIKDSSFTKNIATTDGGAIYNQGISFKSINSDFINNIANYGGAIYNRGTNFIINTSYIKDNTAHITGGAIWNQAYGSKIINTEFINNSALINDPSTANGAGAIYSNDFLDIIGSTFINNTDKNNYAIINDRSTFDFNITNSIFINSRIESVSSIYQDCELTVLINNESSFTTDPDVNFNLSAKLVDNKNNTYYSDGLYYSIYYTNGSKEGESLAADYLFNKVTNLTKSGSYYITAEYKGKYPITSYKIKNSTLNINKLDPSYNVTGELNQGFGGKVTVTLPENAVGTVNITIENVTYPNNELINGSVVIPVDNLELGSNIINLIYSGDDRYNSLDENVTIIVGKVSHYDVNASGKLNNDSVGGQVIIGCPDDYEGIIIITINNQTIIKSIDEDKSTVFDVDNVTVGDYPIVINTTGDDKYEPLVKNDTVTFSKVNDYTMSVTGVLDNNSNKGYITVTLPSDATGTIEVLFKDQTVYGVVNNGTSVVKVANMTAGLNTATVTYSGDNKYDGPKSKELNFTVSNVTSYDVNASGKLNNDSAGGQVIVDCPDDYKGNVTITINNQTITKTVEEGKPTVFDVNVTVGDYPIVINTTGDNKYEALVKNDTVTFAKVNDYTMSATGVLDNSSNYGYITVILPNDATGTIQVLFKGQTVYGVVNNGTSVVKVANMTAGLNTANVTYLGNDKYNQKTKTVDFNVSKVFDYTMNATGVLDNNSNKGYITVTLPSDATGLVYVTFKSQVLTGTLVNGECVVTVTDMLPGLNTVKIIYNGDNKYDGPKSKELNFTVSKVTSYDVNASGKLNNDSVGGQVIIDCPDDYKGNITITINNQTITKTVEEGNPTVFDVNVTVGDYPIVINTTGDNKYEALVKNDTVTFAKVNDYTMSATGVLDNSSNYGYITVTLPNDATGTIEVLFKGQTVYGVVNNGTSIVKVANMTAGLNTANVTYLGNDKYNQKTKTVDFNVNKTKEYDVNASGKLNINTSGGKITIEQPEDLTGTITININNTSYTKQIEKGKPTIFDVDNVYVGKYNVTISTPGDDKYEILNTIKSVTFDKINDYPHEAIGGSNSTVTIILPDDAKGNATITIGNETKTITINETTTTQFDNITPGKYNITVNYTGDDKYNPTVWNQTIKFIKPYSLIISNLTKYYRSNDSLIATLTLDGEAVIGETIEFKLNNMTYSRVTNQYGVASLAINLESGVYNVTATFYDDEDLFASNATITVLTTIEANNLTKRYKDDNQFYAKFLDFDGNPLSNTEVTFNIHGVFYTRTTNSEGITKLNINLDAGEYILTAINPINNEQKAYTITVLSSISILSENLVKYYHNATSYQAVFYDYIGNPLVNTNVTFNIHGVFYNKTTDENGVANLAINLDPGFYVITAFNPVTNEQKGNNVTVKPVLVADDMVVNYGTPIPYEIQVLDGVGTPLEGEVVTMNIHGVIYNKTTNSNGIARLYINLNIGEYVITTTWRDAWASNVITVI